MKYSDKAQKQQVNELSALRRRIAELEALKDERKRTEEELKTTKEYLENVIDNSVDAIGIVDRHGRVILWNRRAAEIYGYNIDELSAKNAFDLYADSDELNRMLTKLRKNGVVREYEIAMKKKEGEIVPMDISISLLKDDRGGTIGSVCVARDLSERKKTEMELRRAKDELSHYSRDLERQVRERTGEITSILKYTPAVVYIKDREGCYKLVNSRFEELFGITNAEIQGKSDYDIFSSEFADRFRFNDQQVFTEGNSRQMEELVPQSDGHHTYLSVKFPLYDEQGDITGVCGISTDITELKQAQDQLRRLSGSIMAAQEKERKAIARELHDELGQVLTALRLDSVWLSEHLKENDIKAAKRALMMRDLIDKTIDEVRSMATRLRPGVLDHFGLIEALQWYIKDFERRTGISCLFKHHDVPDVDDTVATAAYRIAQEALTNVARHSFATHVNIILQAKNSMLTLSVADNGRGFNTRKLAESEGLGLAGMRERASLLDGRLEIQSQPRKGTQVSLSLPIDGRGSIIP
jgi:PAS domain S-box-containing protein